MSTGEYGRQRSKSSNSKRSHGSSRPTPPPTALTPENTDGWFEPCAATASFFLYAQRNVVLVLHHDTLAIERRLELHREDVLWIAVDNVSERGSGRLAVSYDAGNTAIVWDILSGAEIARFSAYEHMRVATFMRNGNIAFGNDQGNMILFEPPTSEHIAARTIFDPITAIAPSPDCRTFAIGYLNGSILIATLQPSFTILHTLTTTRAPSRITGLAWHGSSSRQKTDMLATQTSDGDLRVWSVPKAPTGEPPSIIRVLQRADFQSTGPCWFAWSKNGRIVQHAEGETRSWDVRTKKVTWETVPTPDGVIGVANFGPTAALFTLSRNHFVQQYDITPNNVPLQVASAQHVPANTPPTPPTMLEEAHNPYDAGVSRGNTPALPTGITDTDVSSADEAGMSPLQKIAREMDSLDAMQSELRDKVMPLSPDSSRASSQSSRSSGGRRRQRRYLYDRPEGASRTSSTTGPDGTEFSIGEPSVRHGHESISIRSVSSFTTNNPTHRTSHLRKQIMRSPEESKQSFAMDLFPHTRARLRDVPFRTPHYGNVARTAELLQREMLSVVFGWNDTAKALVRDELSRQRAGSASAVLLSKWLGDMGADSMASMVGSESMTSSDWMLLALSSIGSDSQRKVGEAFVQRLLEKGDVHPAVAILLGLGENNDAIEVYVSQGNWLEAILVTCLTCPGDWGRICYLLRKWGEAAVTQGQAELAVRCFSCTSIETTEAWTSPRAQDLVYFAQQERLAQPISADALNSPPLSPPSRSASGRLKAKNASLKLITTFGDKGVPVDHGPEQHTTAMGVTPIAQSALPRSALSPGPGDHWQARSRGTRDPSSARTATPGGFTRRKRLPSRNDIERAKQEAANLVTPITASHDFALPTAEASRNRRSTSLGGAGGGTTPEPTTALKASVYDGSRLVPFPGGKDRSQLPSPQAGMFSKLAEKSHHRTASRDRKPDGLEVHIMETQYLGGPSPALTQSTHSTHSTRSLGAGGSRTGTQGSAEGSTRSGKGRAVEQYISSVEEARELVREANREKRARSKRRAESRQRGEGSRGASRARESSETRSRGGVHYIKAAKHSPSSPIPMSPEEVAAANQANNADPATTDDENFYKVASPKSPNESHRSLRSGRSDRKTEKSQTLEDRPTRSRGASRQRSPDRLKLQSNRGRSNSRKEGATDRSPSAPLPIPNLPPIASEYDDTNSDGNRIRLRTGSKAGQEVQSPVMESVYRQERSTSRRPVDEESALGISGTDLSQATGTDLSLAKESSTDGRASESSVSAASEGVIGRPRKMSKKELAAKELEERRLSLARRPSAPTIPMPGELRAGQRPVMGMRSWTELGNSPTSYAPTSARASTVEPDSMSRYGKITGMSTPSAPIGLPATPRAMRHPKYMGSDTSDREGAPPVPELPGNLSELSSLGTASSLSQVTNSVLTSNASQLSGTQLTSALSTEPSKRPSENDDVAPLLPSTTFVLPKDARSYSAPPEQGSGIHPAYKSSLPSSSRRQSLLRAHVRKISPPDASQVSSVSSNHASIDEALSAGPRDEQVFIVPETKSDKVDPPMLPELQHLAGPPPPPPPPPLFTQGLSGPSGVINIAIDEITPGSAVDRPSNLPSSAYPQPMERASTTSPTSHRRGRGSVSETFGSRFRGIGDRMRSTSRNRPGTKSPQDYKPSPYETVLPPLPSTHSHGHQRRESSNRAESQSRTKSPYETVPYETVLPPVPTHSSHSARSHHKRHDSQSRAKSPYEQAMAMQQANAGASQDQVLPPPPPPAPQAGMDPNLQETTIPPSSLPPMRSNSANIGYRNPKEIRANMPPGSLQQGVQGGFL